MSSYSYLNCHNPWINKSSFFICILYTQVDFFTNPVYGVCETPKDTSPKISPSNSYLSDTVYNEYDDTCC